MHIRPAFESDLAQLAATSNEAGPDAHWTQKQWQDIFHTQSPRRLVWIAEDLPAPAHTAPPIRTDQAKAIGFLVAQAGDVDWELENIAVLPAFRRQGVGRVLMSVMLAQAHSESCARIFLEVRASNLSATRLYYLSGFQLLSRRRDYYRNPTEDALILVHAF
jgi:ribosomal-protein-alanine acetyltransferase